jgi:hypothetical protein
MASPVYPTFKRRPVFKICRPRSFSGILTIPAGVQIWLATLQGRGPYKLFLSAAVCSMCTFEPLWNSTYVAGLLAIQLAASRWEDKIKSRPLPRVKSDGSPGGNSHNPVNPDHTVENHVLTRFYLCFRHADSFGVLVRFAFSGMYKPASAPSARSASPGSPVGVFIASPACWAARTTSRTVPYFIQSATTGFIASIFPSRKKPRLPERGVRRA